MHVRVHVHVHVCACMFPYEVVLLRSVKKEWSAVGSWRSLGSRPGDRGASADPRCPAETQSRITAIL